MTATIAGPSVAGTELTFTVTFHGPFRIARGEASGGADLTVDHRTPLPASSLKGLMRAAARELLGAGSPWVDAVFGADTTDEGPRPAGGSVLDQWCWSDADIPAEARTIDRAARIRLQPDGTVMDRHLLIGEQVWPARPVTFTIIRLSAVDPAELALHRLILRAAARAVVALGGQRRRGFGWITITDDESWSDVQSAELLRLRERPPVAVGRVEAVDQARTFTERSPQARALRRLTYRLEMRSVIAAGAGSEVGNGQQGHLVIPGSVVRGALAAAWMRDHGLAAADSRMADLFERDLCVGPAVPVGSRLNPASAYRDKYPAADEPNPWIDGAVSTGSPPAGIEYGRGWDVHPDSLVRITRTSLTEQGTAKASALFSETCLRAGVIATGELLVPADDPDALEWLRRPLTLRVGGRRSTGGAVAWTLAAEVRDGDSAVGGTMLVRCLSPMVLVDGYGVPSTDPAVIEQALIEAAGEPVTVGRHWIRTRTVEGWHTASGLPKVAEWALDAGSVIEVDGLTAAGRDRLVRGVGLRRQEGFGRVDVAGPGAPLPEPVADPAPGTPAGTAPSAPAGADHPGRTADAPGHERSTAPTGEPTTGAAPVDVGRADGPAQQTDAPTPTLTPTLTPTPAGPTPAADPPPADPPTPNGKQPPVAAPRTLEQRLDGLIEALGPQAGPEVLKGLANEARRIANFRASAMDTVAAGAARSAVKQAWARQRSAAVQQMITDLLLDDDVSQVRDLVLRRLGD